MAKKRIRITPKIRRRATRVNTSSSQSSDEKLTATSSEEDKSTTTRKTRTNTREKRISAKRKVSETSTGRGASYVSSDDSKEYNAPALKKKRLSEKNEQNEQDSRRKTRTSKRDVQTSSSQASVNKPKTVISRKTTNNSRKDKGLERIRDLIITKKAYSKWRPLSLSTKDYVKQVLDETSLNILSSSSHDGSEDHVQHSLKTMQTSILVKLDKLRGPRNQLDYRHIEPESQSMEELLNSLRSQSSLLEIELQEQKRLLGNDEEKMKKHTSQSVTKLDKGNKTLLHPLLQRPLMATLNLPKLSKEALERPIPKIPGKLEKGAQCLGTALVELKNDMESLGFPSWLESVSQIPSSLHHHEASK